MGKYTIINGELYHYGVKGMKWGIRKARKAEKQALRRASNAVGPKRRAEAMKYYEKKKAEADRLDAEYKSAKAAKKNAPSRRTVRLEKAVKRQQEVVDSWKDASPIKDKRGKTLYSKQDCKDICDAAQAKLGKLQYKLAIQQRADQINRGASAIGRTYNKLTGADKIQAEFEYDIDKRAKVNKAWRD